MEGKEAKLEGNAFPFKVEPLLMSPSHEIFVSKEGGSSCRKRSRAIKEDSERGTIEKNKDRRMRDRMNQKYNELQSMLPKTSLFKVNLTGFFF